MNSAISRRAVIGGTVVAVGAGIAGFVVADRSSYARSRRGGGAANSNGYGGSSGGKRLTTISAVPAGGGVILAKADVVVTRDSSGAVHAFSATCTHQGCQVTQVKNGQILCPCHGSRFDANTGEVVSGPAPRALPKVDVTVQGNDIVAG